MPKEVVDEARGRIGLGRSSVSIELDLDANSASDRYNLFNNVTPNTFSHYLSGEAIEDLDDEDDDEADSHQPEENERNDTKKKEESSDNIEEPDFDSNDDDTSRKVISKEGKTL